MPDREKVVALLERYVRIPNLAGAENYGAKIVDMPAPLITDALALLKAQEPRVMTLEDFENNPNVDKYGCLPCWMEYREEPKWDGWAEATVHTCVEYGRRPWTSRPTDEQREAVPWE